MTTIAQFEVIAIPASTNLMYQRSHTGGIYKHPKVAAFRQQLLAALPPGIEPTTAPLAVDVQFSFRQARSDIDNPLKCLLDAMTGTVYADDSQIVELHVTKRVAKQPVTRVMVRSLPPV